MRWIINHIRGSVGVFLISFLIAPYLYLYHMKKKKEKEIKDKEYRKIIERQKQYYNSMMRNYIGIRKFQHDIGNQLFCLKRFLENRDVEGSLDYLRDIVFDYEKIGTKIETGNHILNMVVEDVVKEEDNIAIEWNGYFPGKTKIRDTDLSVLFANILKNAKEEVMNVPDRKITVTVRLLNGAVFISCKNAVNPERIRLRKGEGRGIGLVKVKEIVECYGGEMKIKSGEEFMIELLFYGVMNYADS